MRNGVVRTAPHFVLSHGPGTRPSSALEKAWSGFDIAAALTDRLGRPARVINDADLQGLAIVSGSGLELVVTLGTGVGTGLFEDGRLAPHFEIAHVPFKNDQTYNDRLGDQVLKRIGTKRWRAGEGPRSTSFSSC